MSDHFRNEFTPLHLAAFTGDVDKASIILEQIGGQEVDCPGFGEVTALHVAVMKVRILFVTQFSLHVTNLMTL